MSAAPALHGLEVGLRGRGTMPLGQALALLANSRGLRSVVETELQKLHDRDARKDRRRWVCSSRTRTPGCARNDEAVHVVSVI